MSDRRGYQLDFSSMLHEAMYNKEAREQKANTIVAVTSDYLKSDLKLLSLLDVGCSTGFIANYLADYFGQVSAIDIDGPAIEFAQANFKKENLKFLKSDSMSMKLASCKFNIVTCAHVYEHVPDAQKLMAEIFRVLKPGGICYFAAANRFNVMEAHYNLPLLSVIPRPAAHLYLRLAGKGRYYYEKHLSYWGLKKLVSRFKLIDYTKKIIEDPKLFHVEYMLKPDTQKTKLAKAVANNVYWLFPTYIWILKRPG